MAEKVVRTVLEDAGISINGNNFYTIKVNDERFYSRVLKQGSLGFGESFMDGWWDCSHIDSIVYLLRKSRMLWLASLNPVAISLSLKSMFTNMAPKEKAFLIGEKHYDLGNDLFEAMLDESMTYSCAYYSSIGVRANRLHLAQIAKLDLICKKLGLKPGQRILDIGCGWGSFAYHAATQYGAQVVGLTVSREQKRLAEERCKGLPVEIILQDYRDFNGKFDHVISIGMFEHVESKNHRVYMEMVKRCLKPEGIFLLHSIGAPNSFFNAQDPWIRKYIFPLGEIPMARQIIKSCKGLFETRDWHEFGKYYDPTLTDWYNRFVSAWDSLEGKYGHKVDGKFFRMWTYYLLACAGSFRAGSIKLWQVVLTHPDEHECYQIVR